MPTNVGTINNDNINDAVSNVIYALDGNDTVFSSYTGLVYIYGGQGNDTIDYSDLGLGYAEIYGGAGEDIIDGGVKADTIYGGDDQDQISGWLGDDYIDGGRGNDFLYGNGGDDTIYGGVGADIIDGGSGNDTIDGGAWDDVIDGGAGADRMIGGLGNDSFVVDDAGDVVVEIASVDGGIDNVTSSISFSLVNAAQVSGLIERLTLSGTGDINGTGNNLDNIIQGNGGANILNGGLGADQLRGGLGDDILYVDNAADEVVEFEGGGNDAVYSSVNYTLAAGQHIEILATTQVAGTVKVNLAGNELDQRVSGNNGNNVLSGNAGNDVLFGHGSNDWLRGGVGNDTLTGGSGVDSFFFETPLNAMTNVDKITDFNVADDNIRLDNAVMSGLGATLGTLTAAQFWKSTTGLAHDADDRIIYETDTGKLFYDSNGNAAGGSVHFATLSANLALTNADFVVI